jgi:hypothetical protein
LLTGRALAAIGPTTAPTANAATMAAAQAGNRNSRRAKDQDRICRITAHLLIVVTQPQTRHHQAPARPRRH